MNWKTFIIILLLIFVLGTIAFVKTNEPLLRLKNEFISLVETNTGFDFEVGMIQFWPLGRVVLKKVDLSKDGETVLASPEIRLYYNFFEILKTPEDWMDSLNYIRVEQPNLYLTDYSSFKSYKLGKKTGTVNKLDNLQLYINNGSVFVQQEGRQVNFKNLNGSINILNKKELNVSLQTGLEIGNFGFSNYKIGNVKLNNLSLNLQISGQTWSGNLNSNNLQLGSLINYSILKEVNKFSNSYHVDSIAGGGQLDLKFQGQGAYLKQYTGNLILQNGKAKINGGKYFNKDKIGNINGSFVFSSTKKKLLIQNLNFNFAGNPYNLNGNVDYSTEEPTLFGHLSSSKLNLASTGLNLNEIGKFNLDMTGLANLDLTVTGKLFNPVLSLDLYLPQARVNEELISYLKTHIRYQDGFLYVDSLNTNLNHDNQLSLQGVINSKTDDYSFDFKGTGVEIGLINKYLNTDNLFYQNISSKIDGLLNFKLMLNGQGLNLDKLNVIGDMEVSAPEFSGNKFEEFETELWLADRELLLDKGQLTLDEGSINFNGRIGLTDNNLNINLNGKKVDLALINRFVKTKLPSFSGIANFSGSITDDLTNPLISLKLKIPTGEFRDYKFKNLDAHVSYNGKDVDVKKIQLDSQKTHLSGAGLIAFDSTKPQVNAEIAIDNLNFDYLNKIASTSLPIRGKTQGKLVITGLLDSPEISGIATSDSIFLKLQDKNYVLNRLKLKFGWNGQKLTVNDFTAWKANTALNLTGDITQTGDIAQKLNLKYKVKDLNLAEFDVAKRLKGTADLSGVITGKFSDPIISGKMDIANLEVNRIPLDSLQGEFTFADNNLKLKQAILKLAQTDYQITGGITNLSKPVLDLTVKTDDGDLNQLLELSKIELPIKLDYILKGQAEIKGSINDIYSIVDFSASSKSKGRLNVKGKVGQKIHLEVSGEEIELNKFSSLFDNKLDVEGRTGFKGIITGDSNGISLSCDTEIDNVQINKSKINKIKGHIELSQKQILSLNQTVILEEGKDLNIDGNIELNQEKLDVQVDFNQLPMESISDIISRNSNLKLNGYIDGKIGIGGTLNSPQFKGKLFFAGKNLDFGLPEQLNFLLGNLNFAGQTVKFSNLTGRYGTRPVHLDGKLNLFKTGNFWNVSLTGENLPFDRGSYKGEFDPDVKITGPLKKPLISGDLWVNDFVISMPFKWPKSKNKSSFKPELALTLHPQKKVYLKNDNINVLIQEGTLGLYYQDKDFWMEGRLTSRQGNFDYYNNRFMLDTGEVIFRKYNDNIPEVHAQAWTSVNGTRITVHVDGLGDNLITSFTSQPHLSEEEILKLLASRGGLGEILSGDSDNPLTILRKEFFRFLRETFQLDFIGDVESDVKGFFHLDQMEINTYNLAWNKEISIFLGERITDRFYLQYRTTFTSDERENELSFNYDLKDNIRLEGSWRGEGDYRLSIETSLDF